MEEIVVVKTVAEMHRLEAKGYKFMYMGYFLNGDCPTYTLRKPKQKDSI